MPLARVVGKCHSHVTYSNANGMYRQSHTNVPGAWFRRMLPMMRERKGVASSAGSARTPVPEGMASSAGRERPPVPEVRSHILRRRELGAQLQPLRLN